MKLVANTIPPIDNEVVWKSLATLVKRFDFKEKEALILMGDMPRSTYTTGIKNKSINLDRDKKERVSYLLGIYNKKSVIIIFLLQENFEFSFLSKANNLNFFLVILLFQ